jgi:hypothetical protein
VYTKIGIMNVKWQRSLSIAIAVLVTMDFAGVFGLGAGAPWAYSFPVLALCPLLLIWHGRKLSHILSFSANEPPDPKNPGWTIRIIGWIAFLLVVLGCEASRLIDQTGIAARLYE